MPAQNRCSPARHDEMDGGNNRLKVTVLAGVVSKAISMVAKPPSLARHVVMQEVFDF